MTKKGYKQSVETKRKISEKNKGHVPWNKGKIGIYSEEMKKKMGASKIGKKHSDEHKRKIVLSLSGNHRALGKKLSEETKQKMRLAAKGKILSKEHREKIGLAQKGNKNHQWKNGATPLVQQIRHSFKYRQWRSDVFTRDDFTCVWCRQRGGILHADHIKSFASIFYENNIKTFDEAMSCEEFWNINNGRTLCKSCHRKTDTYLSHYSFKR